MAKQQVGGMGSTIPVPTADRSRNVLQNVENLYNLELVTRVFEDASIDPAKIVGGIPAPSSPTFVYTVGYGLYGTQNANTVSDYGVQIGYGSAASGDNAISIGNAGTAANNAVGIGYNVNAQAIDTVVIGRGSYNKSVGGVSIGANVQSDWNATAYPSVGIGFGATADYGGVSIGQSSWSANGWAIGIGYSARGENKSSIAMGFDAAATADYAIAIGSGAKGYAPRGTALGQQARSLIGHDDSTAIGSGVRTIATDTVTFGVSNTNKISFGQWAPVVGAAVASTHTLEVTISGTVYKLLATNV